MPCQRLQVGPLTAYVCTRGKPTAPTCSVKGCSESAPYLCDHPIKERRRGKAARVPGMALGVQRVQTTCDRRLCEAHRVQVGDGVDHCPHHAQAAGTVERRPLVFKLELTLRQAPTMNEYAAAKKNRRYMAKRNKQVDEAIMFAKLSWPRWKMGDLVVTREPKIVKDKLRVKETRTGGRRRLVVVHRYSSREPDEISCDVAGGKIPIDRLVQAGVLVDDNRKWLEREAKWSLAPPGKGRVVLSVHELEQVTVDP